MKFLNRLFGNSEAKEIDTEPLAEGTVEPITLESTPTLTIVPDVPKVTTLTCNQCKSEFKRNTSMVLLNIRERGKDSPVFCTRKCTVNYRRKHPVKAALPKKIKATKERKRASTKKVAPKSASKPLLLLKKDSSYKYGNTYDGIRMAVLPDTHVKPGISNDKLHWLGRYLKENSFDKLVCLGDFADMSSLSFYDIGTKKFEGQRYDKDIKAVVEAQEILFSYLDGTNTETSILYGNHEARIDTTINKDPKLSGFMSKEDLQYAEYWDNVYPFKEITMIDGIAFTHYFPGGLMDRPIGGMNPARSILTKYHVSNISGHSHTLNVANDTLPSGKKLWGIVAGWYGEHQEEYVSKTIQKTWWAGLTVCNRVQDGDFDPAFVSLAYLKERYS